jgi:response regulator RpfG family c-di-GMP phosphodiesterase/pSer/pThr/pTyr-binding forkhead associated (FHA) protein
MPRVRIKNGPAKGDCFELSEKPLTIGRDPTCHVQVLDKGASRKHSEIFRIGEMCFIRDLESRNGTFVNDQQIDEELLREGDRIQIGATVLVFESQGEEEAAGVEFRDAEEELGQTMALRLEDLSSLNVSSGDADGNEGLRLRAFYRLSRLLAEESDQGRLTEKALEFCSDQVGADGAYLFAPDPRKGNIVPVGTFNRHGQANPKVSRSIIRRALQEKRALLTNNAMQDSRFSARESIMVKQIHSVICAPLSSREGIGGALYLSCDSLHEVFSEEDLELTAAMAQLIGLAMENFRIQREQRETLLSTLKVLIRASEMRDPTSRGHSERVATYATGIAVQMHLSERERDNVQLAALLHGLGQLVVDDASFFGAGTETDSSLSAEVKQHRACMALINEMTLPEDVRETVANQAERNDGSGPQGKTGDEIPIGAHILAAAHEFDERANRASDQRAEEAIRNAIVTLGREGGTRFHPDVVKALLIAHRSGTLYSQKPDVSGDSVIVDPRTNAVENVAKGRL